MGPFATMAFVFGLIAVLIIGGFIVMWTRDKGRSDSVAGNAERLDTDVHNRPANGR